MKDNRRGIIKKSASLAAAMTIGGVSSATQLSLGQKIKNDLKLNGMAKDAGMEFSNAYFWGLEAHRYLIELSIQMDSLGAVAGISPQTAGFPVAKPGDIKVLAGVKNDHRTRG